MTRQVAETLYTEKLDRPVEKAKVDELKRE